jgi:hypothetical protein
VRNPYPAPVAVNIAPDGTPNWSIAETWQPSSSTVDPSTAPITVDGFTFTGTYQWDQKGRYASCAGGSRRPRFPCNGGTEDVDEETAYHVIGNAQQQWSCRPSGTAQPNEQKTFPSSTWNSVGYRNPKNVGNEPESSRAFAVQLSGRPAWVIPAASGTTPGELAVYVVLPRSRGTLPDFSTVGSSFQYLHSYEYPAGGNLGQCRDANDEQQRFRSHTRYRSMHTLLTARLAAAMTFSFNAVTAYPVGAGFFTLGTPRLVSTGTLNKDVNLNTY